jgi:DNA-binding transcriptional ArsR family regulator
VTAQETEPGGFNLVIHAPNRLLICALLDSVAEIEFGTVQERLKVSASVLSKHVTVLADAGYVTQRNAVRETRPPRLAPAHPRRAEPPTAPTWPPYRRSSALNPDRTGSPSGSADLAWRVR